jgi:starch synthase
MPSKYEPCGLNQIYSLKYGTIPVVRATGGLDDTIVPYDPAAKKGNGFKFTRYDAKEFLNTLKGAISLYFQPEHWKQLLQNAMTADFSWERSAEAYLQLYRKALEKKRGEFSG